MPRNRNILSKDCHSFVSGKIHSMENPENNKQNIIVTELISLSKKIGAKSKLYYEKYLKEGFWWKLPIIVGAMGFLFIVTFVLSVRFGMFGQLPSVENLKDIRNHSAAEVYAEDGVLLGKYFIENRTNIDYDDISPNIINALVATEDARFFEHGGIDLRAWVRVFLRTVLMQDDSGGGGSTLSQQLAKNLYPRQRHRILTVPINKIKEMYLARRLEKIYSKDELLALYLNTVPFSRNIYGVEVASKQFFNTNAKDIKQEQAAVLVGMLKGNTIYDPVSNPERSKKRRDVVLNQMKKYNYLEPAVADSLQGLPLEVDYHKEGNNEGLGTYFREHLRTELTDKLKSIEEEEGQSYNLYTDGLKIYTTIDSRMQAYAEAAVTETLSKLQKDFDKHWKGRKVWGSDLIIEDLKKKTDRYQSMQKAGATKAQIDEVFNKPISMTVFSWDGKEQKEMRPNGFYQILLCYA